MSWRGTFISPRNNSYDWRGGNLFSIILLQSFIDENGINDYDELINEFFHATDIHISNKHLNPDITYPYNENAHGMSDWLIIDPAVFTNLNNRNFKMDRKITIGNKAYLVNTNMGEKDIYDFEKIAKDRGYTFERYWDSEATNYAYKLSKAGAERIRRNLGSKGETKNRTHIEPFSKELARINQNHEISVGEGILQWRVEYEDNVKKSERVPELVSFIKLEIENIYKYLRWVTGHDVGIRDNLKVVLSPLHKFDNYIREATWKDLFKLLDTYDSYGVHATPNEEIRKLSNGIEITDTIDGEYVYSREEVQIIYIYYRVLDASETLAYFADIRRVLSHEMLHAFHHANIENLFNDTSLVAGRVKEALADFFSWSYCENADTCSCGMEIYAYSKRCADQRFKAWIRRLPEKWKYSYAIYFLDDFINPGEGRDLINSNELDKYNDKYRKVFETSKNSMSKAYEILLEGPRKYSFNHHVSSLPSEIFNFIYLDKPTAKKLSREDAEDVLMPLNVNRKEALAPVYALQYLKDNYGIEKSTMEVHKLLIDVPLSMEMEIKATRRILNTLASNIDFVHRKQAGRDFVYWYSEETLPEEEYININTYDEFYDGIESSEN